MCGLKNGSRPINIIITSFNRIEATARCIKSVRLHTKVPYILTVVDDASSDASPSYLLRLYKAGQIDRLFLHDHNMGVAVAMNTGLADEPWNYAVKLDNDMVIEDDSWLQSLIAVDERYPAIGTVGYDIYENTRFGEHGFCGGSTLLITREAFKRVGFFCEEYGLYGEEDSDFGLRVRLSGLKNFYIPPEGKVSHDHLQRSYGSEKCDERRTRKARASAICSHYLNSYLYQNNLRPLEMQRRYLPISCKEGRIQFAEDQRYKLFLERLLPIKQEFVTTHKKALESYVGESLEMDDCLAPPR